MKKLLIIFCLILAIVTGSVAGQRLAPEQPTCSPDDACNGTDGAPTGKMTHHSCFLDTICVCENGFGLEGWCRTEQCNICGQPGAHATAYECYADNEISCKVSNSGLCLNSC